LTTVFPPSIEYSHKSLEKFPPPVRSALLSALSDFPSVQLVQHGAQAREHLPARLVSRLDFECAFELSGGGREQPLRRIQATEIQVGKVARLVARRMLRFFKPRNGVIEFALRNQVCTDIVVWISEARIYLNSLSALGYRIVDAAKALVGPSSESVSLGGRAELNGLGVEVDRTFEVVPHVALIPGAPKFNGALPSFFFFHYLTELTSLTRQINSSESKKLCWYRSPL